MKKLISEPEGYNPVEANIEEHYVTYRTSDNFRVTIDYDEFDDTIMIGFVPCDDSGTSIVIGRDEFVKSLREASIPIPV